MDSPDSTTIDQETKEVTDNIIAATAAIPLIDAIKLYNKNLDVDLLIKAVTFAVHYHGTQKRASGDPYFHHPLAVAQILAEMSLDISTIITAILHDTVEDTEATHEIIAEQFGEDIASLVEGVTKLTKIESQSANQRQAENFRKFLIAMSADIRVLIVKLADRLHNMRTLKFIKKPEKRARIANETMEIYAVLAERIGMHNIKNELQDIVFKELHPKEYASVIHRLDYLRKNDDNRIERTIAQLEHLIKDADIKAKIMGRVKTPCSIWYKMQRKHIEFEQLSDIMAFRVLVDSVAECYQVIGVIHTKYHMIPGKFKDFISTQKKNGYQSLHTVVMGPEQQRIEIQIRTHNMHKISEIGLAAHWAYKEEKLINIEGRQYRWIRELLQIIENAGDADDLIENTKLEMYHDQVFCFTPRGDLIALPKKATPVDFAFCVHTDIGRRCVGAKINGRIAPLRTKLKNGDQVDILLAKSQAPLESWQSFAITGKAQSEIKKTIRTQKTQEYAKLGREILVKFLLSADEELDDKLLEKHLKALKRATVTQVYADIGEGKLHRGDIAQLLFPEKFKNLNKNKSNLKFIGINQEHGNNIHGSNFKEINKKYLTQNQELSIPIMGLKAGVAIHYASCCQPLPGEKISGILNHDKGITIHKIGCSELEAFIDQPDKWVSVSWSDDTNITGVYVARLQAVLKHQKGSLAKLTQILSETEANINNIRITNRATDFFDLLIDIEVKDKNHLNEVMDKLRKEKTISSVWRSKGSTESTT